MESVLRLFSRGNGEAKNGRMPLNATCDLSLGGLLAYLAAPDREPPPGPKAITGYELGMLDGLPLGFTDAAFVGGAILYTAAAEASKDAANDGVVSGSVLGVIPPQGDLRQAILTDVSGARASDKFEGIAAVPGATDRVYVVTDADDPAQPSELCEVQLMGCWS